MPDFQKRRDRLRKAVRELEAQAILVTCPTNVTYLTGFTGHDSFLLLREDGTETLISDPRYEQQIGEECLRLDVSIRPPSITLMAASISIIRKSSLNSLAIEADSITVAQLDQFQEILAKHKRAPSMIKSRGLVERLREIKDAEEIVAICRAIEMAERAFVSVRASMYAQQTEKQVADELDRIIRQLGGKGEAFETIVGVGPRAALPHGRPSNRRLCESPFVLIDWGANEGLYLSDLTRVLVTSRIPPKFERIYRAVLDAQAAALEQIRPGALASDVDATARNVIAKAGFGRRFTHGLGHGFGLQIHESIRLGKKQDRQLEANMVITIEPGIYLPGWGGVRIEDDVLVTNDGFQRLSSLPSDLDSNTLSLL